MIEDYYKILEVDSEASPGEMEKAYRTLAMRYHPDRNLPARRQWAEEKFKRVSEAYAVLRDPVQRRSYDRSRRTQSSSSTNSRESATVILEYPREEEASSHYREGLDYVRKSKEASSLDILLGKDENLREKAKEAFEIVFRKHPKSKYAEEAFYHWLHILNGTQDHSEAFIRKIEGAFEEFSDKYPHSRWMAEVKLEEARFWLLKRKNAGESKKILRDFTSFAEDSDLVREAKALEEYLEGVEAKPSRRREKVCR